MCWIDAKLALPMCATKFAYGKIHLNLFYCRCTTVHTTASLSLRECDTKKSECIDESI